MWLEKPLPRLKKEEASYSNPFFTEGTPKGLLYPVNVMASGGFCSEMECQADGSACTHEVPNMELHLWLDANLQPRYVAGQLEEVLSRSASWREMKLCWGAVNCNICADGPHYRAYASVEVPEDPPAGVFADMVLQRLKDIDLVAEQNDDVLGEGSPGGYFIWTATNGLRQVDNFFTNDDDISAKIIFTTQG